MATPTLASDTPWQRLSAEQTAQLLDATAVRWWLSGGAALDRWLGRDIRERTNTDVSIVGADAMAFVADLPAGLSAWAPADDEGRVVPFAEASEDLELQPILVRDDAAGAWVLRVNLEDGAPRAWVYKRDPRLQLPWDRAVLDLGGVPTAAPETQLVWKALRPRPEDDVDKDAIVDELTPEALAWYERAILSIHPHSSWAIHVRSPFAPAKASWNRKKTD